MIVSPASHKPLYLFHLLHTLALDSALCFTKSVEAATRLAKLVELFEEERTKLAPKEEEEAQKKVVVKAYSSELPPSERTKILASFKKGEIQMYVLSSRSVRGVLTLAQAHLLRPHFARYRPPARLACHQLRRSDRYAQVRAPCWTNGSRWQVGRRLEFGRGSGGAFLPSLRTWDER